MKFYAAFALIIASFSTFSGTEAFILDPILEIIEEASQTIKDLGLDPLQVENADGNYALPVPVIFNAAGLCEKVLSTGLSNIIINDIHYDILGFRLTLDIEMPHIHLSAGTAAGRVVIFENLFFAGASGSIDIHKLRVKADVRIGVLSGIGVRAVHIDSSLGAIYSNINLNVQGLDLSDLVNELLGVTLVDSLTALKADVDELISIILMDYINDNILS